MIISLKHNFIFIKGIKVAGTSIESFLSNILEPSAIIAPLPSEFKGHYARNFTSPEGKVLFNDHMPATAIRSVIGTCFMKKCTSLELSEILSKNYFHYTQ